MTQMTLPRLAAATLLACASLASAHADNGERTFRDNQRVGAFALIGDTPYGTEREPQFDRVIDEINADRSIRFVLHTGDIKAGSERCDDALLQHRFDQFQRFDRPFIYTPGDNEWTDCHRNSNGNYLPLERLDHLRTLFYPQPGMTTGTHPARVTTQADVPGFETFVENQLWHFAGAVMGTIHVVGSNNNLAPWNQIDPTDTVANPRPDRIAEVAAREAAALAWIDTIFDTAEASDAAGVLVAMQANPNFELPAGDPERAGFDAILERIATRAVVFARPVVIAHGDSHTFRMDMPLRAPTADGGEEVLENVFRFENFGSQYVHWVEVTVDPRDPNVFGMRPHLVPANAFAR
ncbi:MAG: metallophosphoesterase [Rhodocyclaceae bacterium]|nr:metallophosphoesterase [Rhodocyclaceae bacterium]